MNCGGEQSGGFRLRRRRGRVAGVLSSGAVALAALALAGCGSSGASSATKESSSESAKSSQTEGAAGGKVLWKSTSVDSEYPSSLTVKAEKEPSIPKTTVVMAQAPYNDHSYQSIGIKKGWFEELGIEVTPKPMGKTLDMEQMAPALIANQIQIGTMANSVWLGAIEQTTKEKIFTYVDTFIGHAILGNPKGNYKTFAEFHEEGKSFKEAVTDAVEQLKGKTYAYSGETSQRPFQDYVLKEAGMSFSDFNSDVLEDPKIVELATANRIDFASPTSGPLVTQLLREGWKPVVSVQDLVKYGNPSALESSIINDGFAATDEWLAENHGTALRLAAVSYKILQFKKEHELEAAKIQIPFLNSIAGTKFQPSDAKYLDHEVDPFFTFEEQKEFFENKESPWFWEKDAKATIESAVESGTVKEMHDPKEIILADDTWKELKSLKEASEKLMQEVESGSPSGKASEELTQAKKYFAGFDFLDALRFAGAAQLAESES